MDTRINEQKPVGEAKLVAVIDLGTTAIRMQISQIKSTGEIEKIESLVHGVSIGKDSFSSGAISRTTIEDCIRVLKIYRRKLQEYGIVDPRHIRVVATSGVREATNRLAFQDRVFIATGLDIEAFDEAELHRVTYLGIQPFFEGNPEAFSGRSLVAEVGGGSTELILLNDIDVIISRTVRLGSLRLRKALEVFDAPVSKTRKLLESQIQQVVQQIYHIAEEQPARYIAMGGDIRFVVAHLGLLFQKNRLAVLPVDALSKFTNDILQVSPNRLMALFHLSQADAESLGPALLTHLMIAEKFKSKEIFVANVNLRDGLIKEIAQGVSWNESVQSQIVRTATRLGKRYDFDQQHANQVAYLACRLFEQLKTFHGIEDRHQVILHMAGLLHEIGIYVNNRSYHKHSMYLIRNSEFFGVSSHDLMLISLVARYHRRAMPLPTHEGYSVLTRYDRILVAKLASILRIAVALDSTRQQRIQAFDCTIAGKEVQIVVDNIGELAIEAAELQNGAAMFEQLFGSRVSLVGKSDE